MHYAMSRNYEFTQYGSIAHFNKNTHHSFINYMIVVIRYQFNIFMFENFYG